MDEKTKLKLKEANSNPEVKKSFITQGVVHDGKLMREVTTLTRKWSPFEGKFVDMPKEVTYEDIVLNKKVELKVIETRTALDTLTLRNVSGLFVHDLTVTIDDDVDNVSIRLVNGRIILSHIGRGMASELTINSVIKGKRGLKYVLSEGKRITLEEARKLLSQKNCYPNTVEFIGEGENQDCRVNIPYSG